MTSVIPIKLAFKAFDPVTGVSDEAPILFMHGITASKENWEDIPQVVANVTKRKVYALDARNHGDSEWSDHFDFECMVDDVLYFLDTIKTKRAVLVGHSMGGIVGIKTALRVPERVEKLVVEDMYVKRVTQSQCDSLIALLHLSIAALQHVPDGSDEETAKKFIVDFIYKKLPAELLPKVSNRSWTDIELKRTENGRYSFKFNTAALESILKNVDVTLPENKGVYTGPTSFMYGGLSPYQVGGEKEDIKKFFPNTEFVEFANATHRVHSDCNHEFTEALIKFILK